MNEEEFEIKEKINTIKNTVINLLKIDLNKYKDNIYMLDTEEAEAIFKLLDKYKNLQEIEEEHRRENGLLRVELKDVKEQLKNFYEGELYTAKQLKNLDEGKKKYYIHKDKIKNKIKWYEEACEHLSSNGTDLDRYDQYQGAIEALQSLLEE